MENLFNFYTFFPLLGTLSQCRACLYYYVHICVSRKNVVKQQHIHTHSTSSSVGADGWLAGSLAG